MNFKKITSIFLEKYPYINEFKYYITSGAITGGLIGYHYNKYKLERYYSTNNIPIKVLIVPTISSSIIGGLVWPVPTFLYSLYGLAVISEKYDKWVEKEISQSKSN